MGGEKEGEGGDEIIPFTVRDGETFIDTTYIAEASITTAMIEELTADKITAVEGVASPFADIGTITAGTISSSDGRMTLDLDNGTMEFLDASGNRRVFIGNF